MRIAVVGAGLVGLNGAHALLDDRHEVVLVDARDGGEPRAGRPSDGNAGFIAHTDIRPLASPKIWRQLPGWLADPLGPLAIRPAYLPRLAPFLARFLLASTPARIEAATIAIRSLNALALPAWRRRLAGLDLSGHLRERGYLYAFSDPASIAAASPTLERQRAFGIAAEFLDGSGLRRLEPALGRRLVGAIWYPEGGHVADPRLLTAALLDAAVARGAVMHDSEATSIRSGDGGLEIATSGGPVRADRVVIAAGAWSRPLAAGLGDRVPLDTERGYNTTFPPGTFGLTRPVLYEGHGFVTTPFDTGDRVGGGVEFGGLKAPPDHRRGRALVEKLRAFLPGLPATLPEGREWMGFRPSLPDSLPVIGPASRDPRVLYAFGHGHHGLTQAAATGDLVAAMVAGRPPPIDTAPFRASRFRRS